MVEVLHNSTVSTTIKGQIENKTKRTETGTEQQATQIN